PVVYEASDGQVVRRPLDQARELLKQAGYPDGRDEKTGKPLILHFDSAGGTGSSAMLDWMRRQLADIDIELEIRATDYNRFQDKMRRGTAQMYMWGWVADYPDAENFLFLLYGPNAKVINGGENASNYQNDEYERLFDEMRYLDDGPEKDAIIHRMTRVAQQDAPWMFGYSPKSGGAWHGWVANAKPTQMVRNTLQYYRLDPQLRADSIRAWNAPVWWRLVRVSACWSCGRRHAAVISRKPVNRSVGRHDHLYYSSITVWCIDPAGRQRPDLCSLLCRQHAGRHGASVHWRPARQRGGHR